MVPLNKTFTIVIKVDRKDYQLQVACIFRDQTNERYKVTYGKHDLMLECTGRYFETVD